MPVKLKPTREIIADLGLEPNGEVQKLFTTTCAKAMDKFVPYEEGTLRQYKIIGDLIIYDQPYARYMYYGKKMVMSNGKSAFYSPEYGFWSKKGMPKTLTNDDLVYHTPGTGPYWDKRMWSVKREDILKTIKSKIRRG